MPKNIILCSDGTSNTAIKGRGTNVFKLFEAVDLTSHRTNPKLDAQLAFYDGIADGHPRRASGQLSSARQVRREIVLGTLSYWLFIAAWPFLLFGAAGSAMEALQSPPSVHLFPDSVWIGPFGITLIGSTAAFATA